METQRAATEFSLLDPALQRWVFRKGWEDLLPVQKAAVRPVLECRDDVIISASTASGKTEAAFLPALSAVCGKNRRSGLRILYISPLKALINDQYRRIAEMAQDLGIAVTPWHGDISSGKKERLLRSPDGVILTTPESLESMLINRRAWLAEACAGLKYIIIDEFHAFMGTQRGYQLQSQLHRIENLCGRLVPRIALSATFSDSAAVTPYLRPRGGLKCQIITAKASGADRLAVQLRGYDWTPPAKSEEPRGRGARVREDELPGYFTDIAKDIFRLLRNTTNLVFCNSRYCTETLATELQKLSERNFVPNEFFPHHGSLSKELRESLEHRLIEGRVPTNAICTATLELGIDISDVRSIAQVEPPLSVASLRQRLGRSGRRDHLAVLRLFIPERYSGSSAAPTSDSLCEDPFLTAAMVNLLLKHWYEPPLEHEYAFSTLLQQTLSVIASFGSVTAKNLYDLLCRTGPFLLCTQRIYAQFLRDLASRDLITQLNDGTLTLGLDGEELVSDWSFYSAFYTPDEYTIEHDGRVIGSVPMTEEPQTGLTFLFAGRGWKAVFVNRASKIIGVKPWLHDAAPLNVSGTSGQIHDEIRKEMFRLYVKGEVPEFLNKTAHLNFVRGLMAFKSFDLEHRMLADSPSGLEIYPWRGDRILRTMILMLRRKNVKCTQRHSHIELIFTSRDSLRAAVGEILKDGLIDGADLLSKIRTLDVDKHDDYISRPLKCLSYAWSALDVKGALECFKALSKEL